MPTMDDSLAISEITVADVLKSTPRAVRFFIEQGTVCAGCSLACFCTLKDVVNTFVLDEKDFLEELAKLNVQKS